MKLAAFDLEIASSFPDDHIEFSRLVRLGITCAAVALSDQHLPQLWKRHPRLSVDECIELVNALGRYANAGYTLVTWNGCQFDFQVLAGESGLYEQCGRLAWEHVDMMAMVTFTKGYFLSLEKALIGAGLGGKQKSVTLRSGRVLNGMDGSLAPELWAQGETEAVLSYLKEDVLQTLRLAQSVLSQRRIRWTSNRGTPQEAHFERLFTIRECFGFPLPDVSWMSSPPRREQFTAWIPDSVKTQQR